MRNLNSISHDDGELEIEITNTQTVVNKVNKYTYGVIFYLNLKIYRNTQILPKNE